MTKKDKAPETEPKTESKNNYNFTINVIEGEVENIKLSYSGISIESAMFITAVSGVYQFMEIMKNMLVEFEKEKTDSKEVLKKLENLFLLFQQRQIDDFQNQIPDLLNTYKKQIGESGAIIKPKGGILH